MDDETTYRGVPRFKPEDLHAAKNLFEFALLMAADSGGVASGRTEKFTASRFFGGGNPEGFQFEFTVKPVKGVQNGS